MELLVVLATLVILGVVLLPALAGTQPRQQSLPMPEQHAPTGAGRTQYADEHNEYLPLNFDPRNTGTVPGWIWNDSPAWITGILIGSGNL